MYALAEQILCRNKSKKKAEEVEEPEKAAEVIKKFENIKTNKKGIVRVAYYQDKEKFSTLVNKLKIHKTTIIFKINIYKLCERFPKLLNSSIGLGYFKNFQKHQRNLYEK